MRTARSLLAFTTALSLAVALAAACGSFGGTDAATGATDGAAGDGTMVAPADGGAPPEASDMDASVDASVDADADGGAFDFSRCDGGKLAFHDDLLNLGSWNTAGGLSGCEIYQSLDYGPVGATIECEGNGGSFNVIGGTVAVPSSAAEIVVRVAFLAPPDGGPATTHAFAQLLSAFGFGQNLAFSYDPASAKLQAINSGFVIGTWSNVGAGFHTVRISLPPTDAGGSIVLSVDDVPAAPYGVTRFDSFLQLGPYLAPGAAGHARDRYAAVRFWSCP